MKTGFLLAGFGLLQCSYAFPRLIIRAGNGTGVTASGCASGVHMIIARGSREDPGPGITGVIASMVMMSVPGSDMESVDYPATLENYPSSEALGVAGMTKQIQAYTTKCPNSKYALLGYSQGAQVIGDTLAGSSEAGQKTTPPIPASMTQKLVAIIQMGDPTHIPNQPQEAGNSTTPGIFVRANVAPLAAYSKITQSYCDAGDLFCSSGTSIDVHRGYVTKYGKVAATYVSAKAMNGTVAR